MAAIWRFLAGEREIEDSELPAPADRREPSPEGPCALDCVTDFFRGTPITDAELPAREDRVAVSTSPARVSARSPARKASPPRAAARSPARKASPPKATPVRTDSKRGRDDTAPVSTPATAAVEEKLATASAAKTLTRSELSDYLTEKGEQVPSNAKKDKLLELARTASRQSTGPAATPAAATPAAKPPQLGTPVEEEEKPKLNWTITRLKSFAAANKITYPANALKHEIYEAIVDATSPRKTIARSASKK